jgi:hypothetical protein
VGEDLESSRVTIPTAIATAFWTFGAKSLELEITGNGGDGGPYRITAPLNVIPEPVNFTWWTWTGSTPASGSPLRPPPPGIPWKSTYTVTGRFTNRARAPIDLTALSAVESIATLPTAPTVTVSHLAGAVGTSVPPGGFLSEQDVYVAGIVSSPYSGTSLSGREAE